MQATRGLSEQRVSDVSESLTHPGMTAMYRTAGVVSDEPTAREFHVRSPIGRSLLLGSIGVAFASLLLRYVALGRSFGLLPVSGPVLLALGLVTAAYVAASEVAKRMFFRRA